MSVLEPIFALFFHYPILFIAVVLAAFSMAASLHKIGPTEVGLVTKRFSFKKLTKDNPVAFNGEAGYQADLLMPGLRWKTVLVYSVDKYPWIQVPAGEIGVVIAQVGSPLPIGAKSAVYKKEFANFSDLRNFIQLGGQKGVQRPVLPPGSLVPDHHAQPRLRRTNLARALRKDGPGRGTHARIARPQIRTARARSHRAAAAR